MEQTPAPQSTHSSNLLLLLVLAVVALAGLGYLSGIVKTNPSPNTSTTKTQPKTFEAYKPISQIKELDNCGLADTSRKISALPYVMDFTSQINISGKVEKVDHNTTSATVIGLKTSNGLSLSVPYTPQSTQSSKTARLVTDTKTKATSTVDSLKAGDSIVMKLQCRIQSGRSSQPAPRLETIGITKL